MFGLSLTKTVKRLEEMLDVAKEAIKNLAFNMDDAKEPYELGGKIIVCDDDNVPSRRFRVDLCFEEPIKYQKFLQSIDEFFSEFCKEMETGGQYTSCRFTDLDKAEESHGEI